MWKGAKTMGSQRDNLLRMGKGVTKGFKEVNIWAVTFKDE